MTVSAKLEGHPFDLDALARQFPTGDPHIVVTDEGTFLETTALDALFDDAGRLVNTANEHLARLNGYAILADVGYQAVRLRNRFFREGVPTHVHLMAHDEARARDSVTVVAPVTAEARAKRRRSPTRAPGGWTAEQRHDARRGPAVHPRPGPQMARLPALTH